MYMYAEAKHWLVNLFASKFSHTPYKQLGQHHTVMGAQN